MKNRQAKLRIILGTALAGAGFLGAAPALACGDSGSVYMGTVCITAATYCARGYVEADGRLLSISQFTALYSLLGTNYGGNGITTFGVPDLRGRTPVGFGHGPGLSAVYQGQMRGNENTTLTIQNLAAHNHSATFTPSGSGSPIQLQASTGTGEAKVPANGSFLAAGDAPAGNAAQIYSSSASNPVNLGGISGGGITGGTVAVDNNGGSQPFSNVPPQQGMRYCIAVDGLYPPRP